MATDTTLDLDRVAADLARLVRERLALVADNTIESCDRHNPLGAVQRLHLLEAALYAGDGLENLLYETLAEHPELQP